MPRRDLDQGADIIAPLNLADRRRENSAAARRFIAGAAARHRIAGRWRLTATPRHPT